MALLLRAVAPWVLAGAIGALVWTFTPVVGTDAVRQRLEAERDDWKSAAEDYRHAAERWHAARDESEAMRALETSVAQSAAASLIEQCGARVAEARRSARAIETLVTQEPTYDENRCPVRRLADPGQLRDALGLPAAG